MQTPTHPSHSQPLITLHADQVHVGSQEVAELIEALRVIVLETMHYSPARRMDFDSYLPEELIEKAQRALQSCGRRVTHDPAQVAA